MTCVLEGGKEATLLAFLAIRPLIGPPPARFDVVGFEQGISDLATLPRAPLSFGNAAARAMSASTAAMPT